MPGSWDSPANCHRHLVGNDNFTSMNKVTGGLIPARIWHQYMVAATTNYNIPPIPGVPFSPAGRGVERVAEIKKDDPTLGTVSQAERTGCRKRRDKC